MCWAYFTVVFETELMGIEGVKKEEQPPPAPPQPTIVSPEETTEPTSEPALASSMIAEKPAPSAIVVPDPAKSTGGVSPMEGDDNGECHLLGPYALIVQGALGLLAVSSLIFKRYRETPRRPLKIWFFDASKQVFGSVLLHLANILMSMLSSGSFDVAAKTAATPQYAGADEEGKVPNPCSFYLLNLAIDVSSFDLSSIDFQLLTPSRQLSVSPSSSFCSNSSTAVSILPCSPTPQNPSAREITATPPA